MSRTLRTMVVGLGRIGWEFHAPAVSRHEGFQFVAVVDPATERRDEARMRFGVQGFAEYPAAFDAVKPDLVVIASPTPFHAEQAIAAMQGGADVFCDKPVAMDLAQTDRMVTVMRQTGRKLMVYQPHRGRAYTVAMRSLLARNLIGPVYMMKRGVASYVRRNDWQAFTKYGGGMLNNYGAHYLDQLLYVAQDRPRRAAAHLRAIATLGDADDVVKVVVETERGLILDLDINTATTAALPEWIAMGKYGSIEFRPAEKRFRIVSCDAAALAPGAASEGLAAADRKYPGNAKIAWREEFVPLSDYADVDFYQKVYEYVALDQPAFVPIDETRTLMALLDDCRRYAAAGRQA